MIAIGLCFALLTAATAPQEATPPELLRRAVEYRASLYTALVELKITDGAAPGADAPRSLFFTYRAAGDRSLLVNRGDASGRVVRFLDEQGHPVDRPGSYVPRNALLVDGLVWTASDSDPMASVAPKHEAPFPVFDVRSMGLNPTGCESDLDDFLAAMRQAGEEPAFIVAREDALDVVTAKSASAVCRWWLDPSRGGGIVRSEMETAHVRTRRDFELDLFDGIWFPKKIDVSVVNDDSAKIVRTYEILAAEFNRPEHPPLLDLAYIGIEPGKQVEDLTSHNPAIRFWDGGRLIEPHEYTAALRDGTLRPGPTVRRQYAQVREQNLRRLAREREGSDPPSLTNAIARLKRFATNRAIEKSFETRWEAHTRRFIEKYKLTGDQAEKAWAICRECQERARQDVQRRRDDFQALDAESKALQSAGETDHKSKSSRLEQRRKDLEAPIQAIFDESLCPALEKLPTAAQRRAVQDRKPPSPSSPERP